MLHRWSRLYFPRFPKWRLSGRIWRIESEFPMVDVGLQHEQLSIKFHGRVRRARRRTTSKPSVLTRYYYWWHTVASLLHAIQQVTWCSPETRRAGVPKSKCNVWKNVMHHIFNRWRTRNFCDFYISYAGAILFVHCLTVIVCVVNVLRPWTMQIIDNAIL